LKKDPLTKYRLSGNKSSNVERQQEIRAIIIDGLKKEKKNRTK